MTPEDVKPIAPDMMAHMMDVMGHHWRCVMTPDSGAPLTRRFPARHPLVTAIPAAVFEAAMQDQAQQQWLDLNRESFCGGLTMENVMER